MRWGLAFKNLRAGGLQLYIKGDSNTDVSYEFCGIFKNNSGRLHLASSSPFPYYEYLLSRFRLLGWIDLKEDIEKESTIYIAFHVSEKPFRACKYLSIRDKSNTHHYLIHFLHKLANVKQNLSLKIYKTVHHFFS